MRVVVDTNILLDVALGREPHLEKSLKTLRWAESHPFQAALSCHCLDTLHYLLSRGSTVDKSKAFILFILEFFDVVPLERDDFLLAAKQSAISDFEDALVEQAAIRGGANFILTRNIKHFRRSRVQALSPRAFLQNTQAN